MALPTKSYNAMLSAGLTWRGRWLDMSPRCNPPFSDRDVLALGLLAQILEADAVVVDEHGLSEALSATLDGPGAPSIRSESEPQKADDRKTLSLTAFDGLVTERFQSVSKLQLAYGLHSGFGLPTADVEIRIRSLSSINPCFWNCGLAIVWPTREEDLAGLVCDRLGALIGDQSLDPLSLYDEICCLEQQLNETADVNRAVSASDRGTGTERELFELRLFVQVSIERAALAQRRAVARSGTTVVDWGAAFTPVASAVNPEWQSIADLDEVAVRARRARTEAEFLRGQLRAYMPERNVSHHDLIAMSGFFDVAWYSETYGVPPQDAIHHYLNIGFRIGADPSPIFSTTYYLQAQPDVDALGFNPLVHYLMDGIYEGRSINPPLLMTEDAWIRGIVQA